MEETIKSRNVTIQDGTNFYVLMKTDRQTDRQQQEMVASEVFVFHFLDLAFLN